MILMAGLRLGIMLALVLALRCAGERHITTASLTLPRSSLRATALENLRTIQALENATGRTTRLAFIGGLASLDGRIVEGGLWRYQFASIDGRSIHEWRVWFDGRIDSLPEKQDFLRLEGGDLAIGLTLDSPEAIKLARELGAEPFVERYADATVSFRYRMRRGSPVCDIGFLREPTVTCALLFTLHPTTRTLLAYDLSCYQHLPP
jgi:hypothetical protein